MITKYMKWSLAHTAKLEVYDTTILVIILLLDVESKHSKEKGLSKTFVCVCLHVGL